MQIIYYHRNRQSEREKEILSRAAHRQHLLRKTVFWDIFLFVALGILGPVLHFIAPQVSQIPLFRGFLPINESIWEHLKLIFYPAVAVGLLRRIVLGKLQRGILTTFAEGILLSMALLVAAFYTYSGILGMHFLTADIALYYLCSLVLAIYVGKRAARQKKSSLSGVLILLFLTGCFLFFSFYTPNFGLFLDISQSSQ